MHKTVCFSFDLNPFQRLERVDFLWQEYEQIRKTEKSSRLSSLFLSEGTKTETKFPIERGTRNRCFTRIQPKGKKKVFAAVRIDQYGGMYYGTRAAVCRFGVWRGLAQIQEQKKLGSRR